MTSDNAQRIDERVGMPDCDCGHTSMRHHGEQRDGRGYMWSNGRSEFNGCKDCSWCDYYKPRYPLGVLPMTSDNESAADRIPQSLPQKRGA